METPAATRRRRSIRNYTDRPVPEELVNERLNAAMAAPSAGNEQPWHFIAIRTAHCSTRSRQSIPTQPCSRRRRSLFWSAAT